MQKEYVFVPQGSMSASILNFVVLCRAVLCCDVSDVLRETVSRCVRERIEGAER